MALTGINLALHKARKELNEALEFCTGFDEDIAKHINLSRKELGKLYTYTDVITCAMCGRGHVPVDDNGICPKCGHNEIARRAEEMDMVNEDEPIYCEFCGRFALAEGIHVCFCHKYCPYCGKLDRNCTCRNK